MTGWFTRLGAPLDDDERAGVSRMLRALDFPPAAEIASIGSWAGVGAALRADDRDSRAWDAEEAERERLWAAAAERMPESELLAALNDGNRRLREAIQVAAAAAAARSGMEDASMIAAAAGAALLAVHQQHLATLAGAGDAHYFQHKFRLFAGGRWPLGLCDGRFVVF
ncbi:MAG: hypothetical protein ABI831_17330 [Betaproteobacteria bacterium]